MLRLGQFGVRTVKADGGEIVAQRGVGPVEQGLGSRKGGGEILAHADGLSALSGEK
jgi:hypothetical protein